MRNDRERLLDILDAVEHDIPDLRKQMINLIKNINI